MATILPQIDGEHPCRLMRAPIDEAANAHRPGDLISAGDMLAREPWADVGAGSSPQVQITKDAAILSFVVAVEDLSGPLFETNAEEFALVAVQRIDSEMTGWAMLAKRLKVDLAYESEQGAWVGRVSFVVRLPRELAAESMVSREAA